MSFHGQYLSSGLQLSKQMSYKDLVAEVWDSASKCSMNGGCFLSCVHANDSTSM